MEEHFLEGEEQGDLVGELEVPPRVRVCKFRRRCNEYQVSSNSHISNRETHPLTELFIGLRRGVDLALAL